MVNVTAAVTIPATVLAHQGGWDEMLLVAGPIALVVGLLALARRRVTRAEAAHPDVRSADADRPT
ncbi:MAG: hypothetical protein ABW328_12775 [Ilumatobacteraceae bacterium]